MAFLDNSGDIILDAVLTDTGRLRLSQGDGSFKISKFALGDDEINYGIYNKTHSSGSAYYDLEIMQTPILEAFTNNSSQIKSRLMTMSRTNILYMPVLKLNRIVSTNVLLQGTDKTVQVGTSGLYNRKVPDNNTTSDVNVAKATFYVCVDDATFRAIAYHRTADSDASATEALSDGSGIAGCLQGYAPTETTDVAVNFQMIRVDQGLDTSQIAASIGMDSDLLETAFIVEMDYRLGRIKKAFSTSADPNMIAPVNFIDDDNIATYYLTSTNHVNGYAIPSNETRTKKEASEGTGDGGFVNPQAFAGPRGSTLHLRVEASAELKHSTYLFEQLGVTESATVSGNVVGFGTGTDDAVISGKSIYYIDSTLRVIGANTGFRLDIPVRYIKIQ